MTPRYDRQPGLGRTRRDRNAILLPAIMLLMFALGGTCTAQGRITGAGTLPMTVPTEGVDVLTRSYDISRSGADTHETTLTPANVGGLKKLFSLAVTDDPRLEAQPLIVTHLKMKDGLFHNVVYVCTMDNDLWAFDADTGAKIWAAPVNLDPAVKPPILAPGDPNFSNQFPTRTAIDLWGINKHWGILSTPVIDRSTNTMYIVDWTSPDGSVAKAGYHLHAVNLADGKEKPNSPIVINASVTVKTKDGISKTGVFKPNDQKQRSALLLLPAANANVMPAVAPLVLSGNMGMTGAPAPAASSTLIMACGGFGESAAGQHGWVLAFDPITLRQTAAFCTTPATGGGGIWQAGQGPSADASGNIYVMTANGGFNGDTDFAESFLMLHYTPPPVSNKPGSFTLTTWFTPFRDADRLASEPGTGYSFQDQDLGSAGPVLLPGTGIVLGAGKDGVVYVLQRGNFGNTSPNNLDSHTQFASLLEPPFFFTYFPGFQVDATNARSLDSNFNGQTHHLHNAPVIWDSPDHGPMVFCWGENEHLRAWGLTGAGKLTFLANGLETASAGTPGLGGMPGGMLCLSANENVPHTGIVWTTAPITGDGNKHVVGGIVRAYDAAVFGNNNTLTLLWDSSRIPGNQFDYDKFCPPVVADGKVFVTTYDGRVDVYGL